MFEVVMGEQDAYAGKGSGFTLECIDGILLGVYQYSPMEALSYILIPPDIAAKKAVINPKNDDHQCFKWIILGKHVTGCNKFRVSENYKKYEEKYNFSDIAFSIPVSGIKTFEQNNLNVLVNLHGLERAYNKNKVENNKK